jgi:hypothetical protein
LTQKEVTTLKEARFSFDRLHRNNVWSLFGFQSSSSSNSHVLVVSCHNLVRPSNASCWLTTCGGKKVKWPSMFKITQHTNNWEVGRLFFQCTIFPIVDVPPPKYGWIQYSFLMTTNMTSLFPISLDVHVSTFSKCWEVLWVPVGCMCNVTYLSHLANNYVLWEEFIHYFTWSWDEIQHLLEHFKAFKLSW